ncbi:MAG: hypothetical protein CXR31_07365 [Geobacter sp.]|nr:MAG: hypothetical protein CXR31_07365 [Geobacter sp.]
MKTPSWLQENAGLRIMSLVLAFFLWAYVTGGGETERGFTARVATKNLPAGLVMTGRPVERVEVRLAGPRLLLAKIAAANNLSISLDLDGAREGSVSFAALETRLPLPAGVRITRIYPATIEIGLARGDGGTATPAHGGE